MLNKSICYLCRFGLIQVYIVYYSKDKWKANGSQKVYDIKSMVLKLVYYQL